MLKTKKHKDGRRQSAITGVFFQNDQTNNPNPSQHLWRIMTPNRNMTLDEHAENQRRSSSIKAGSSPATG